VVAAAQAAHGRSGECMVSIAAGVPMGRAILRADSTQAWRSSNVLSSQINPGKRAPRYHQKVCKSVEEAAVW
jgi:hypothetical protein